VCSWPGTICQPAGESFRFIFAVTQRCVVRRRIPSGSKSNEVFKVTVRDVGRYQAPSRMDGWPEKILRKSG